MNENIAQAEARTNDDTLRNIAEGVGFVALTGLVVREIAVKHNPAAAGLLVAAAGIAALRRSIGPSQSH